MRKLGISIYPEKTDEKTLKQYIDKAGKAGFSRIFSCLLSVNEEKEKIIRTHRAAQKLLRKVNIVNDFAPYLNFPVKLMRTRRDHDRFMDLIACVCFLRQHQKKEETEDA